MDYFVKGRIQLTTEEDLTKILAIEDQINATPMKSGYVSRRYYGGSRPDLFTFQSRSIEQPDALKLFGLFKDLIQVETMTGWIGWHTCKHEDGVNEICQWNQIIDTMGGVN